MDKTLLMHIMQRGEHLLHHIFDHILRQSRPTRAILILSPHVVKHSPLDILKHKIDVVIRPNHLFHLDYIRMLQFPQSLHLAKAHGLVPTLKLTLHFLDSDRLSRLQQNGLKYSAIGPIATVFNDLKFIH